MASTTSSEVSNVTGAIVFVIYVLAALSLTTFLTYSLLTTYVSLDPIYKRLIDQKLQMMTVLSCVSFSVLSYNMLNYLIVSYKAWTTARNIPLPTDSYELVKIVSYSDRALHLYLWQWLTTSTLFRDFAQTICRANGPFFWTGQALVTTMAWSIFMSVEGLRKFFLLLSLKKMLLSAAKQSFDALRPLNLKQC